MSAVFVIYIKYLNTISPFQKRWFQLSHTSNGKGVPSTAHSYSHKNKNRNIPTCFCHFHRIICFNLRPIDNLTMHSTKFSSDVPIETFLLNDWILAELQSHIHSQKLIFLSLSRLRSISHSPCNFNHATPFDKAIHLDFPTKLKNLIFVFSVKSFEYSSFFALSLSLALRLFLSVWNESDTGAPANDVADVDDERSVKVKPFVFYTQCAV